MPPETKPRVEVLYCGDTSLDTAASYLAGLLANAGIKFHYVPSDKPVEENLVNGSWSLVIVSDYPSPRFSRELQNVVVSRVEKGAGLLMIGGWESFHGLGGDWDGTPIGDLLPVVIGNKDDRWNCDRPLIVKQQAAHPIVDALPFQSRPPLIGGLNRIQVKPGDTQLLSAEQFQLEWNGDTPQLKPSASYPLLVVGKRGQGRVATFSSDVAPHWVGPLVDWGDARVTATAPGAPGIEVGDLYTEFFTRLVLWTAGRP
ncbi:hypothetical protein Pan44_29570 [Caulifigura coniformis]|uniref:Putative glutamine amidotransferase domain-containing protein n=1 Tax=Caulifigura coniformis TaxID=2527983 RepID=A0A517SFM5_9PLAN|nr:glutamine amidotransferase [Caulifigura coniformis]QDT54917.1 hypothetical protein Pan44_29570 [Caulifigura coniformis]